MILLHGGDFANAQRTKLGPSSNQSGVVPCHSTWPNNQGPTSISCMFHEATDIIYSSCVYWAHLKISLVVVLIRLQPITMTPCGGRGKIQIGVNYPCSSVGSSYTALCTVFHLGPVCLCRPPCCTWLHSLWHSSGFGLHQCHPTLQLPITWDYTHRASPSSLYLIIFLP